jgi:hypothetical protein
MARVFEIWTALDEPLPKTIMTRWARLDCLESDVSALLGQVSNVYTYTARRMGGYTIWVPT